jgi:gluconokinase
MAEPVVVMGVCGSGKSTVGRLLAEALGAPFLEGDVFHSPHNIARMAAGVALTDEDRQGWLCALAERIGAARARRCVSRSAPRRSYRDTLARTPDLPCADRIARPAGATHGRSQRAPRRPPCWTAS